MYFEKEEGCMKKIDSVIIALIFYVIMCYLPVETSFIQRVLITVILSVITLKIAINRKVNMILQFFISIALTMSIIYLSPINSLTKENGVWNAIISLILLIIILRLHGFRITFDDISFMIPSLAHKRYIFKKTFNRKKNAQKQANYDHFTEIDSLYNLLGIGKTEYSHGLRVGLSCKYIVCGTSDYFVKYIKNYKKNGSNEEIEEIDLHIENLLNGAEINIKNTESENFYLEVQDIANRIKFNDKCRKYTKFQDAMEYLKEERLKNKGHDDTENIKNNTQENKETNNKEDNLFKGCDSKESLTKRYHQLMKIYHPDNQNGDTDMTKYIRELYQTMLDKI